MKEFHSEFAPQIQQFLAYRKALCYSLCAYESSLFDLDKFCIERYPNETVLTKEIVLEWMKKKHCKKSGGFNARACVIRKFAKYLDGMGFGAYILPIKFVGKQVPFTPHVFSDEEITRLFSEIDKIKSTSNYPFASVIMPVLFRLIYTCGLRPNEGRELKTENISLDTGEILITATKRHKDRMVVLSEDMRQLCIHYECKRKIFAKDSEYFFPKTDGTPMSNGYVRTQLKACWTRANVGITENTISRVRVYDLRHQFATATLHRWLDMGLDLNQKLPYLSTYMGHEQLSQTAYYIHLLPENLLRSNSIAWEHLNNLIPEVDV